MLCSVCIFISNAHERWACLRFLLCTACDILLRRKQILQFDTDTVAKKKNIPDLKANARDLFDPFGPWRFEIGCLINCRLICLLTRQTIYEKLILHADVNVWIPCTSACINPRWLTYNINIQEFGAKEICRLTFNIWWERSQCVGVEVSSVICICTYHKHRATLQHGSDTLSRKSD